MKEQMQRDLPNEEKRLDGRNELTMREMEMVSGGSQQETHLEEPTEGNIEKPDPHTAFGKNKPGPFHR